MKALLTSTAVVFSLGVPALAWAQMPPPQNDPSQMQAGGLRPPPPEQTGDESARTEERLETAEKEDSGRGLEFVYVNLEGGVEHLGLQTFSSNNLVDSSVIKTTQTGPLFGAGLGLRLLFLTVGPRFRLVHFSDFDMWTLGLEVGYRIPLGNLEPYFQLGGGYASVGAFSASKVRSSSDVSIRGYDIRGGGGIDYYVTPVFSVGANATVELVGLSRSGVDGSSLGFGVAGTVVLGLHF